MEDVISNKGFQMVILSFLGILLTMADRKPDMITAVFVVAFLMAGYSYMTAEDDPSE